MPPRTRTTPSRRKTTQEVVEVVGEVDPVDLGDLRALVKAAEGMPDEAVITVAGLAGFNTTSDVLSVRTLSIRGTAAA